MLGKSHFFYGVTLAGGLALLAQVGVQWPLILETAAAGGFGALLPDLDEPGSTISNAPRHLGRLARDLIQLSTRGTPAALLGSLAGVLIGVVAGALNVLSRLLSSIVRFVAGGHREGSHWLPIWAGLSVIVYLGCTPLLGIWPVIGFSVGYLSHLISDGCTRSGIPLVPYGVARLHLLPRPIRVRTGALSETVFSLLYAVALVGVGYLCYSHGYRMPTQIGPLRLAH